MVYCIIDDTNQKDVNKFIYKCYYYDIETKFYYLNVRYYDPYGSRFISADSTRYLDTDNVGGLGLFIYSNNNRVMYVDPSGNFPFLIVLGSILLGGLISGAFAVASESDSNNYLGAFVGGFINGVIGTAGLAAALASGGLAGFGIAFVSGFAGGFLGDITSQQISYGVVDWTQSFIAGGISGTMNLLGYFGMHLAELMPVGTWGEKFVEAIVPTIASLSMTNYLSSLIPSNLYQRKGKTLNSHFMKKNIFINLGFLV